MLWLAIKLAKRRDFGTANNWSVMCNTIKFMNAMQKHQEKLIANRGNRVYYKCNKHGEGWFRKDNRIDGIYCPICYQQEIDAYKRRKSPRPQSGFDESFPSRAKDSKEGNR